MESYLKDLVSRYGEEYVEIRLEERESTHVGFNGAELDNVGTVSVHGGSVRLYKDGIWTFTCFNGQEGLERHLQEAVENAVYKSTKLKEGRKGGLSKSERVISRYKTSCKEDPRTIPLSYKVDLMNLYNGIILEQKNIETTQVVYRDTIKKSYYANSEGSYIEADKVFTGIGLHALAKDGMNIQRSYYTDARYCGFEIARGLEKECYEVSKRAQDLLKAKSIKKGKYKVLLDPRMSGVFAHEAFGHLSESDFLYENEDMRNLMVLGRQFGVEGLNIVDDATIEGAGYVPYDDEGVRGRRKYLIKGGKLNARLNSRETAYEMSEELSGNARALGAEYPPLVRMTNTFIDKGDKSFEELLSMVDDGIYCVDYIGGMTNLEMFTFTAGRSYEIKNGKLKRLLKDVVLTGNVFETLGNIKGIGDDVGHFGGLGGCGKGGQNGLPVTVGGPHIVIEDVVIGGK